MTINLTAWDCEMLTRALEFYLRERGYELSQRALNDARALGADLAIACEKD